MCCLMKLCCDDLHLIVCIYLWRSLLFFEALFLLVPIFCHALWLRWANLLLLSLSRILCSYKDGKFYDSSCECFERIYLEDIQQFLSILCFLFLFASLWWGLVILLLIIASQMHTHIRPRRFFFLLRELFFLLLNFLIFHSIYGLLCFCFPSPLILMWRPLTYGFFYLMTSLAVFWFLRMKQQIYCFFPFLKLFLLILLLLWDFPIAPQAEEILA